MDLTAKLTELGFSGADLRYALDGLHGYSDAELKVIMEVFPRNGGYVDFGGQNCDDARYDGDDVPCQGWDGYSRRCECGNRRVAWIVEGNTFAYGEAH